MKVTRTVRRVMFGAAALWSLGTLAPVQAALAAQAAQAAAVPVARLTAEPASIATR